MPSVQVKGPIQWDLWPLFFTSFICHFHLRLCFIYSLLLLPVVCVPALTKTALSLVFPIHWLWMKCSRGCILISKHHKHPGATSVLWSLNCCEIQALSSRNILAMKLCLKLLWTLSPDFDYPARNFLSSHSSPKYYIIHMPLLASFIVRIFRHFIKLLSLLRTTVDKAWDQVLGN